MRWTPWSTLEIEPALSVATFRETIDGGQAFRWKPDSTGDVWQGVWSDCVVRLRWRSENAIEFSRPENCPRITADRVRDYLGFGTDWNRIADELPWRSDPQLRQAMDAFPGLRLLNQPFAETLLCFLCSATKQIPQIKAMCDNLASALGDPIGPNLPHRLPDWTRIAEASEDDLRALGLGFRARNIKRTADLIAADPNCLENIERLPYAEAHSKLLAFPGVGSKIADCSLLFGANKLEAFPVDTWILKTLQRRYNLEGWKQNQLEQFGKTHFGSCAGYAQQFFFAHERANAKQ